VNRTLVATTVICAVVSLGEAAAYLTLARAVADGGSVVPVLVAAVISVVLAVAGAHAGFLAGARYSAQLYAALGRALTQVRLSWFTEEHRSAVTAAAGSSVPALMGIPAHHLQTLVPAVVLPPTLVVGTGVLLGVGAALAVLVSLVVSLGLQVWTQLRLLRADADRSTAEHGSALAALGLVDHLLLHATATGPTRAVNAATVQWESQQKALDRTNGAAVPAAVVAPLAGRLPALGAVGWLLLTGGDWDPTAALALVLLALRAGAPLQDLALAGVTLNSVRDAGRVFREVVGAPTLAVGATGGRAPSDGTGYELRLPGLRTSLPAGALTRVTGRTGAGKSTLLGLLLRFSDPEEGAVLLDGVPLPAIPAAEFSARLAYVPQDPTVFTGTLAGNITMAVAPDAADAAALRTAVSLAALDALVDAAPDGTARDVGTRGSGLSGGEQQRVSVARAFYRVLTGADILVLDEPTSALDTTTATAVVEGVQRLRARRPELTVVVVSHRGDEDWSADREVSLRPWLGRPSTGR
jgi:ATP-binding cassette subfamily B protein